MSWAADLKKIAEKGSYDIGAFAQAIKIELFSETVDRTTVDEGRLAGNWNIQENSPDTTTTSDKAHFDPTGERVNAEIRTGVTEEGVTYFTNHLPYAKVIEDRVGMVKNSVIRVEANVADIARSL